MNLPAALILSVILPVTALAATPTISNITGTIATGQTITITGTNMLQESNSTWDTAFQGSPNMYGFESAVASGTALQMYPDNDNWYLRNNYQDDQPPGNIQNDCRFISSPKLSGSLSMQCRVYGGMSMHENDGGSGFSAYPGSNSGNYYFRFYTRYHSNNGYYPDNYTKMAVTQPSGSGAMWYLDLGGAVIGQNPTELTTKYGAVSGPSPAFDLQDDRWYCIEGAWLSPGTYQLWVDGTLLVNTSPGVAMPDNTYPQWGIINYGSNGTYTDFSQWTDNLAFGHTSRIYPSSVIQVSGDGTTWKYQEPVSLSETSSQVKLDLTGLTGTDYRLRVTNNMQQTSTVYYLDGELPTSPGELRGGVCSGCTLAY